MRRIVDRKLMSGEFSSKLFTKARQLAQLGVVNADDMAAAERLRREAAVPTGMPSTSATSLRVNAA